jgi:hypothetical protein
LRRGRNRSPIGIILFALIIAGAIYIYTSSMFERDNPIVTIDNKSGYWNLKSPIKISISDESGIKYYKISLKTSRGLNTLKHEEYLTPEKSLDVELKSPRAAYSLKDKEISIVIEVNDASKWNLLAGNKIKKEYKFHIDKRRPNINIITNSYGIKKGGSALVVFKVSDENIKDIYIQTNDKKRFIPESFYKDGYYISLLAWSIRNRTFEASIIATDYAGNVKKTHIPLYLKSKYYKVSNIKLSDRFLKGKIADLAEEFEETQGVDDSIEQFKIINEKVREKNELLIHELSSKVSDERLDSFKMKKMYPLKNAQVVASFGDHRKYFYKGQKVSESYHLGLDLASNAMAEIKPQNGGEVVFADYNGLYGNMPMISHGLGLYTIYGHCSTLNVNSGDYVNPKDSIANTGKSGYAMGDHLHFGVLVQGVEVRPEEWMDTKWIKLNIDDIISEAKKIIDNK